MLSGSSTLEDVVAIDGGPPISVRTYNCFHGMTLDQLARTPDRELLKQIRGCGPKSLAQIRAFLPFDVRGYRDDWVEAFRIASFGMIGEAL